MSTQVEEALDALERLATAAVGWPNADYEDDRVVADAEIVRELIVRSALRERAEGEPQRIEGWVQPDMAEIVERFDFYSDRWFKLAEMSPKARLNYPPLVRATLIIHGRSPLTSTTLAPE